MKTLFKLLAAVIACAVLGLPTVCKSQPTLEDFGYGKMVTKRAVATAVILVNFTNAPADVATPYTMGGQLVGTDYRGAEQHYSNWFFSRTTSPRSVNGYFHETSNGRFQWTPAPVCMLTVPTNVLYRVFFASEPDGPHADRAYFSEMIGRAMDQGLNLTQYDLPSNGGDGNGVLIPAECTIQLLINDKTLRGGGARNWYGIPGRVTYSGKVTFQEFQIGLPVVVEELVHVLQDGICGDIYGISGMSDRFTAISGNTAVHLDSWHKLNLAWCEPRRHPLTQPGQFTLPAAQLMETNGPVILYDPIRGTREFFVLEYRTTNTVSSGGGYDAQVKDNGLVIWHAQVNGAGVVADYTPTYFPGAEANWRRCAHCFNLFYNHGDTRPCALSGTNHVAQDGHIALPCDNPAAEGVPGWRWCQKCGQLYYHPNQAVSVCSAGGQHLSGACDYRLRHDDDPEALGQRGWLHCGKCQSLYKPHIYEDPRDTWHTNAGICKVSGPHESIAHTNSYTVFWNEGVRTIMTEGSPDLSRARGDAWHGGDSTPLLRWFDGTLSRTRIAVQPFSPSADQITIEIQPNYDAWVDFAYGSKEDGSFERPFNTFAEGMDAVYTGGVLHIKAGTSPETRHVNKAMRIESYGGPARIGRQ